MLFKNIPLGDNKISFSQTSKGVWYCSDITIYCKHIPDGIKQGHRAMIQVDDVLSIVNQNINPSNNMSNDDDFKLQLKKKKVILTD